MVAVGICGVRAQTVPVLGNLAPAAREEPAVVAVSGVRNVVIITEVNSLVVGFAVARMVTHGLHANLLAVIDHDVAVLAPIGRCLHNLELVLTSRHTIARAERYSERSTVNLAAHERLVLGSRVLPRVSIRRHIAQSVVAIGTRSV